jgi:NADPH:quinone reductase-like Zn-dependent oxidoreductase
MLPPAFASGGDVVAGRNSSHAVDGSWIGDHRVRLPIPTNARGHVRLVRDLLASGDLRPVVDRTSSLDDIVDAYRYVGSEQKLGTVAVTVA